MVSSRLLPDLPNDPAKTNWVEKAGGLPDYITRVAKHIFYDVPGKYTEDHAIAAAVEITKKRAASGNKEAQVGYAEWLRKRGQTKLSVTQQYRNDNPTVRSNSNTKGYPIGSKAKLAAAIKLYKMHKAKYTPEKRSAIKAHILAQAKRLGVTVSLANPMGGAMERRFNEQAHRRVGGKFAPKPGAPTKAPNAPTSKPQSVQQQLTALRVGDEYNIPGIDGKIIKTVDGFKVTGPNGFTTTASNVTSAMAVAANLIRKKGGKNNDSKTNSTS